MPFTLESLDLKSEDIDYFVELGRELGNFEEISHLTGEGNIGIVGSGGHLLEKWDQFLRFIGPSTSLLALGNETRNRAPSFSS